MLIIYFECFRFLFTSFYEIKKVESQLFLKINFAGNIAKLVQLTRIDSSSSNTALCGAIVLALSFQEIFLFKWQRKFT